MVVLGTKQDVRQSVWAAALRYVPSACVTADHSPECLANSMHSAYTQACACLTTNSMVCRPVLTTPAFSCYLPVQVGMDVQQRIILCIEM